MPRPKTLQVLGQRHRRGANLRWFLLIVGVAVLEITLLILVGSAIGGWTTLAILFAFAVFGVVLVKREARLMQRSIWGLLQRDTVEGEGLSSRLWVAIAGLLFICPGFLTDLCGLLLLVPPIRKRVAARVIASIGNRIRQEFEGDESDDEEAHDEQPVVAFPFASLHDRSFDRGDVLDTEGVEVQQSLLLGEGVREDCDRDGCDRDGCDVSDDRHEMRSCE